MARRGALDDDDDSDDSKPTSLEFRPFSARVDGPVPKKVDDRTLPVGTASRSAEVVEGFTLTFGNRRERVTDGQAQLGSDPGNAIVIADATVSRIHCEVRVEADNRVVVRDLGSTNGTFVDGVRVREAFLKSGARLKLGAAEVRFELDGQRHVVEVSSADRFGELVGSSSAIRRVFTMLERAAATDSTLILEGETGTGKTRAASTLHALSARADKPFLVVDCGALPPSLLEAELFGHEKGAFTGATTRRLGVFEEAEGGTVLLDEIGELPLELQPRLLRVLEERQIKRLGQNRMTPIDVRILAATHRDLRQEVNAGRFRSDLYFRLAVLRVAMPALRERAEDLPAIAEALLTQLGASRRTHSGLFRTEFLEGLAGSSWPGNVRELRNYLERCMLFDEPAPLTEDTASPSAAGAKVADATFALPLSAGRQRVVEQFEREYLVRLLARHGGSVSKAAPEAEVDRVYLYRLLRKYGLKASGR
ncbi:MAG: sigma 54-interacting transcriptional regulator [Myxococcaceae bacterium]